MTSESRREKRQCIPDFVRFLEGGQNARKKVRVETFLKTERKGVLRHKSNSTVDFFDFLEFDSRLFRLPDIRQSTFSTFPNSTFDILMTFWFFFSRYGAMGAIKKFCCFSF